MKFVVAIILSGLVILAILAMLYHFFRWIYRTWLSDAAADKAEIKALTAELEEANAQLKRNL